MEHLQAWRSDPEAAAGVFALASPLNRAATGPLPRFKQLVESPGYACLIDNRGWIAGAAEVDGDVAAVLVSLVADDGRLRLFRFYLSRTDADGRTRWATDAVVEAPPLPPGAAPAGRAEP